MTTTPRNTTAPDATGRTMRPTMVPAKIAKRRQLGSVIPSGRGARRIPPATAKTMAHLQTEE
jgi:hypothetical protein